MNKEKLIELLKKFKNRIIAVVAIIIILTAAFLSGEKPGRVKNQTNSSEKSEWNHLNDNDKEESDKEFSQNILNANTETAIGEQTSDKEETAEDKSNTEKNDNEENNTNTNHNGDTDIENHMDENSPSGNNGHNNENNTGVNEDATDTMPQGDKQEGNTTVNNPESHNPSSAGNKTESNSQGNLPDEIPEQKRTCTFSISCATILNNMNKLDRDKTGLVPKDGWILKPVTVEIEENETVFDLLKRICMDKKIHMEFSWTPLYNSAYIEGIHNLYEFDCGSLSGWMYCVNGVYYNYGCSKAVIGDGDIIDWVYTCDLGKDVKN